MGLLDIPGDAISGLKNLIENPFNSSLGGVPRADFSEGFVIQEILANGKDDEANRIVLAGNMLPKQPFKFGGTLRHNKQHYPGSNEPVFHISGSNENDVVINGRLYDKRYKSKDLRGVAYEMAKLIIAARKRGNLMRIKLGEWERYGFLVEDGIDLKTLADLDYTLTFSISGFQKPFNYQILGENKQIPETIKRELVAAAQKFQSTYSNIPKNVPRSIADKIRGAISDVATVIATVTGFIDTVVETGQDIGSALNRGIGLVRFAQNKLYNYKKILGGISYADDLIKMKPTDRYRASAYISSSVSD